MGFAYTFPTRLVKLGKKKPRAGPEMARRPFQNKLIGTPNLDLSVCLSVRLGFKDLKVLTTFLMGIRDGKSHFVKKKKSCFVMITEIKNE